MLLEVLPQVHAQAEVLLELVASSSLLLQSFSAAFQEVRLEEEQAGGQAGGGGDGWCFCNCDGINRVWNAVNKRRDLSSKMWLVATPVDTEIVFP